MRITLVLLILLIQHDLHSQAKRKYTSCSLCKERSVESHSPYRIDAKTETPFIIASTVIGIGGYIIRVNDHVNPYTQAELDALDRNDINSFDRGATLNWNPTASHNSDIFLGLSFALNGVFLIDKHTRSNLGPIVLMGLEVTIINSGLTSTVIALVNRTRPYVYNHDLSYEQRTDEESRRSFYSGHASVSASWSF
ncbi:MAG: phosphatase PAP2 family protein, partial [Schleiferiaceae bacterium]|nr:phosphatase PAP2 family protein [Schleiferiaceae bacterium]